MREDTSSRCGLGRGPCSFLVLRTLRSTNAHQARHEKCRNAARDRGLSLKRRVITPSNTFILRPMNRSHQNVDVEALRPEGSEDSGPFGILPHVLDSLCEVRSEGWTPCFDVWLRVVVVVRNWQSGVLGVRVPVMACRVTYPSPHSRSWRCLLICHLPNTPPSQEKDDELVARLGGPSGLAAALDSSPRDGVEPDSVELRRETYGANVHEQLPPKNFFRLWYNALGVSYCVTGFGFISGSNAGVELTCAVPGWGKWVRAGSGF